MGGFVAARGSDSESSNQQVVDFGTSPSALLFCFVFWWVCGGLGVFEIWVFLAGKGFVTVHKLLPTIC